MVQKVPSEGLELELLVSVYFEQPTEALLSQIIEEATGLVYHFASQYSWGPIREDLIQAGFEGLLKALKRFEPERKVRFSTYASHYIKGEIRRELWREATFDKPLWLAELKQKINSRTDELRQSLQREPTLSEIAEAVNVREDGIVQAMLAGNVPLEELDLSRIRNIRYESFQLPIEDQLLLREALSKLSAMQRRIIYLIFYQDLSQTRAAELLGTNQRRVSRLLKKTLEQLALYLLG